MQALNRQLNDMVRFLTDPNQHTVMGIDSTFNFGDFNVIPIAFCYLFLEHRKQGHPLIMLVTQKRWFQMTPQQREHYLSKVSSASLKNNECTNVAISLPSLSTTPDKVSLSLSLSDVNIPSLREVLK